MLDQTTRSAKRAGDLRVARPQSLVGKHLRLREGRWLLSSPDYQNLWPRRMGYYQSTNFWTVESVAVEDLPRQQELLNPVYMFHYTLILIV